MKMTWKYAMRMSKGRVWRPKLVRMKRMSKSKRAKRISKKGRVTVRSHLRFST